MRMLTARMVGTLAVMLGTVALGCSSAPSAAPLTVATDAGRVRGTIEGSTRVFRGIRYAAPPVGPLRWRPPQPVEPWTAVRDAVDPGPACAQLGDEGLHGAEDCLRLNVWTPTEIAGPLPVMFYVHGGDNVAGSGSLPRYDGRRLSERGAVVVTFNYRLAAFGFLAHPAFALESETGATGNYGLLDQIAALGWVRRNVAAFGGDPERVLLFGTSAGAVDTCALLASPLASGLFHRALMESGPCYFLRASSADHTAELAARLLGCSDVPAGAVADCLRKVPAEALVRLPGSAGEDVPVGFPDECFERGCDFNPVIDGYVLPEAPLAAIRTGRHNAVPLIVGTTANEYTPYVRAEVVPDAESYRTWIDRIFDGIGSQYGGPGGGEFMLEHYPVERYASPREALIAALNDRNMNCPARRLLRAASAAQSEPTWQYLYAHAYDSGPLAEYGPAHGFEVDFIFGNFAAAGLEPTDAELRLADLIAGYWVRFAAEGDPNGGGSPTWPRYEPASAPYLVLDTEARVGHGWRQEACAAEDPLDRPW